ncbi:MAG TPA: gamma-glutamylcyclotransferase family protein [Longimicrobiales bacterium]|nr:gamma-glutamylcyclotransferase family protein [Longimicrobiales bacterium]
MPLLFAYGSLQQEAVQISTLGRRLAGETDELPRFESAVVEIEDEVLAAAMGKTHHANVKFNGQDESRVSGTVFSVSNEELDRIDQYEIAFSYKRMTALLASGKEAWVYFCTEGTN